MDDFDRQRARLVRKLQRRGIRDERVLAASGETPRERFVASQWEHEAYADTALPYAAGQTISQPFIVALMTQLLRLQGDEKVLEIGTGTGYQTALLSRLARRVVTIERLPVLMQPAREVLESLGLDNIEYHTGDGTLGWPASAPYQGIVVPAGAPDVPAPLYNQLATGGRLVIPVGDEETQELKVVLKTETGPSVTDTGACRFVKLIGNAGWDEPLDDH